MSGLVTIYGGSGFLGRYIAQRMAAQGWRIRIACRHPYDEDASGTRIYGVVGQVAPVLCNIRDDESVRTVMQGADVVINCVGVLSESGANTFDAIQHEGPERIARIAAELGVARMVHVSAIGADADSDSDYARSKAAGEAAVLRHMPQAVILRPSIIFGREDEFFNRFAAMSGPILPVVGADTRFQPVYVDDVARAVELVATGAAEPGVYELGGPDVMTFRELMQEMLGVIRRRKLIVNMPFGLAGLMAGGMGLVERLSFGLIKAPLTGDQVAQLRRDNVVAEGARGFDALGLKPISMGSILPEYLWRFRTSGQYAEIKESARNLRRD
ncbi:complex I NDUFA9 subunit family protein [Pseudoroseicyclus aestuarii]|uniref:NADH dehydrogenase n=1 Tax=Pseudoroseicyclus aestuarii TaxID=1795041 RepID=A0A318SX40_9RHOB|nr:complex I NDUFA9 subunit family protein [Pseudoroseicyclus aestuarii]PYE84397.1 NADH dehydrogenase [Pseudoroseicyclus aestuarii]